MHCVTIHLMYKNIKVKYDCVLGIDFNVSLQASKKNMSELESGMIAIIKVFRNYTGHKRKLKKAELKELINNEMSNFIMVRCGSKSVKMGMFMAALCMFECNNVCCCKSDT